MECLVCRLLGYPGTPAEVHHLRSDGSMGKKGQRWIPLCPYHHRGGPLGESFHAGPRSFQEKYGSENSLWEAAQSGG